MNNQNTIRKITRKANLLSAGANELAHEAARRFARLALKKSPPLTALTRAKHTEFLKKRILEMRLPRGKLSRRKMAESRMSKKTARKYFRIAKARQGELIGAWTKAAQIVGIPVPGWISRHGGKHGSARAKIKKDTGTQIAFTFKDSENNARTNMRSLSANFQNSVYAGMKAEIQRVLKRKLKA